MAIIRVGGVPHTITGTAPLPRLRVVGLGYLELTTDSALAPSRPRMAIDISGTDWYIRELYYTNITTGNVNVGASVLGRPSSHTIWTVPYPCKTVNFKVQGSFWNISRYDSWIDVYVRVAGVDILKRHIVHNDSTKYSFTHTVATSSETIAVKLIINKGDPQGTNDNYDSLIYNVYTSELSATVLQ
jgi:hypothetical protein